MFHKLIFNYELNNTEHLKFTKYSINKSFKLITIKTRQAVFI